MAKAIKSVIKIVAFVLILSLLLYSINSILEPKFYLSNSPWPTTSTYHSFYKMKRNTIDVLFLGSSYCVNAFSPPEIYNQYGIRCYNLGSEQQSIFLSYYWLKEALNYQSPSVVVLEGRFLRPVHPESPLNTAEGLIRKCLDPMKISSVKIEAINELCKKDKSQIKSSWYLTNIRFHDRWKSLSEIDFDNSEHAYSHLMGWMAGTDGPSNGYNPLVLGEPDVISPLDPLMVEYFEKTAVLCKQKGIKLILVNVPYGDKSSSLYYAYKNLCDNNDVDFYELSLDSEYSQLGVDLPQENPVAHGNIWGNIKISRYIGRLLTEKYHVSQAPDAQYDANKAFYEHIISLHLLKETTDIDEYLSLLNDEYFYLFVSARDVFVSTVSDNTRSKLINLGFSKACDMDMDYLSNYVGIKTDQGVFENIGTIGQQTGRFRQKYCSYSIISRGHSDEGGAYSSIIIDSKEQSMNSTGFNIVVYDTTLRRVLDSIAYDPDIDIEIRHK